jgi:cytochrome P450
LNATRNSLVSNPTEPSDYLRHVLAESFRCVPVAANITVRQVGREYTFTRAENNRTIRLAKGSIVFMPQYAANRDPDVYNEPDAFDPERWIHPTSAMKEGLYPFSLGSRNCIGQSLAKAELDSVLPRLLSTYDFELVEEGQLDYFLTLKFSGARLQATRVG